MSFIGPALPPHLMRLMQQQQEDEEEQEEAPATTSEEPRDSARTEQREGEDDSGSYGPALPPGFEPAVEKPRIIGPVLPPGVSLGLPQQEDSSDDDDPGFVVGPLPMSASDDQADYLKQQFESRADRMRQRMEDAGKEKAPTRESWMTELPKNRTGLLGLEARSFRRNAGPDPTGDNSAWTDTPEEKKKKAQGLVPEGSSQSSAAELEAIAIRERDEAMAKRAAKHASKRASESLLDSHQKKLNKKKKEEEEKPKQRAMFDREKDLQVNRFDEAQKKAVFNKAKLLDDRFSSGGRKYL